MKLVMSVVALDGTQKWHGEGEDEITLSWRGMYEPGDKIVLETNASQVWMAMSLDVSLAPSIVLLHGGRFEFRVPMDQSQVAYGKGWAFQDERHWAYARVADQREVGAWRNVALNSMDVVADADAVLYPHASTNVVSTNAQFCARNAIDGVFESSRHGSWPHESWGMGGCADAWLRVDFGSVVVADELRLHLRADFPHDTCWDQAVVSLSTGERLAISLQKTGCAQSFDLGGRAIRWLRLESLHMPPEEGFAALSQLEVWGRVQVPSLGFEN